MSIISKFRFNLVLFTISLVILAGLIIYGDPAKVLENLTKIDLSTLTVLVLFAASGLLLRFLRFKMLLDRKYRTKYYTLFPVFTYGIALANTLPARLGEPLRALLVKKSEGVPIRFTLACIFLERLSDMFVILSLSLFAFIALGATNFLIPYSAVVIVIFFVVVATQFKSTYSALIDLFDMIITSLPKFMFKKQMKYGSIKIKKILTEIHDDLRFSQAFLLQLIFAAIIWGMIYPYIFYSALSTLGVSISFITMAGIYTLSLIVGLVSFLPGGIGSAEAASTLLLTSLGVDYAAALTASLITRALSLWDVVILGPLCSPFIKEKK